MGMGSMLRRARPVLGLIFCCHRLESLFKQKAPHFHFALGLANDIAGTWRIAKAVRGSISVYSWGTHAIFHGAVYPPIVTVLCLTIKVKTEFYGSGLGYKVALTANEHDTDGEDLLRVGVGRDIAEAHTGEAAEGEVEGSDILVLHRGA